MLRRVLTAVGAALLIATTALGVAIALVDVDALIERYRPVATSAASSAIGRPVEIGAVRTAWWPRLAIVAEELEVQSSTTSRSEAPLLELPSLRLRLALWPALRSLGRDIAVDEIVFERPRLRIRRRPDGTTNLDGLGEGAEPEDEAPMTDGERRSFVDYLETATIDRIAIEDGVVEYTDGERSRTLENVDLEIRDIRLGRPVRARLAFALNEDGQNVELEVETAPLPPTLLGFLPPAIERVSLSTDVPVGAELPRVTGYDLDDARLGIRLSATTTADGLRVLGPVTVGPIRWADGERRGEPFELSVGADVRAPVPLDQVDFSGSEVQIGPLRIEADGTAQWSEVFAISARLQTPSPVSLSSLSPLAPSLAGLPSAPVELGTNLEVSQEALELQDLRVALGGQTVRGRLRYPLSTGTLRARFEAKDLDPAALARDLRVEADGLPPGARLSLEGAYTAPRERPADGRLELARISLTSGAGDLSASGEVTRFSPVTATVRGSSNRLDLDALLPPAEPAAPTAEEPPPSAESGLAGLDITAEIAAKEVIYAKVTAQNARCRLRLRQERLTLEELSFEVFGGRVSAAGTQLDLSEQPTRYDVVGRLETLRASDVFGFISPALADSLEGRLSTDVDVSGAGLDAAAIAETLSGSLAVALADGKLRGVDLIGSAAAPITKALQWTRFEPSEKLVTDFRELAANFRIESGRLRSERPVRIQTPSGAITLEGDIGLDQSVSLDGTVDLSPDLIQRLSRGKLRPSRPIPVGMKLGCSFSRPCVKGIKAEAAVESLLRSAADDVVEKAKSRVREEVESQVEEAESRARREADRAAEDLKKKAEEEAKKKLRSIFGR